MSRLIARKKTLLEARFKRAKNATHMSLLKSNPNEQKEEAKVDHPLGSLPIVAVLTKNGCKYSQNGYQYLASGKGGNRKNVYDGGMYCEMWYGEDADFLTKNCKLDKAKIPANFNPRANYKHEIFGGGLGGKKTSNQKFPYNWQGHHVLPASCFYSGKDKAFTPETKSLLLRAEYDVNHGQNLIMLPGSRENGMVPVHALLQHYTNHKKYNKEVISRLKSDIHQKLEEKLADKKDCEDIMPGILEELIKIQDMFFKRIVHSSRAAVMAVVAGKSGLNPKNKYASSSSQGVFPRLG